MRNEQFEFIFTLMVILIVARISYETNRPPPKSLHGISVFPDTRMHEKPESINITPQQKRWAEKAVRRYAETQEKKWRNWNKAMFENR